MNRSENIVYQLTLTDIDRIAGREVTTQEAQSIARAIPFSSIPDALDVVVSSVVAEADHDANVRAFRKEV